MLRNAMAAAPLNENDDTHFELRFRALSGRLKFTVRQTLHPKTYTLSPELSPLKPEPCILNPEPYTLNPAP